MPDSSSSEEEEKVSHKRGAKRRKINLAIKPIQPKNAYQHPPVADKVLPQHEFSVVIVAPKGSGKTNLICNLLLNHYKGYFHDIWVCSPTVDNDPKWEVVRDEKHILAENKPLRKVLGEGMVKGSRKKLPKIVHKTEKALEAAHLDEAKGNKFTGKMRDDQFFGDMRDLFPRLEKQDKMIHYLKNELGYEEKAKFIADRVLIILDDQAGLYQGSAYGNPMINFMLKHRHYNSSVIVVTQAYKAIPKSIRTNCNALVVFEVPNMNELKVVYEEWPANMSEDVWMQAYQHAVAEPFAFLYINTHFKKGERVYKNFTHRMRPSLDQGSEEAQQLSDTDEKMSASSEQKDKTKKC